MNILILGAGGFLGKNIALDLSKDSNKKITMVDKNIGNVFGFKEFRKENIFLKESNLDCKTDFSKLLSGQDIVYHLVSSNIPSNSNKHIAQEIEENVVFTSYLLDECIKAKTKKVVFISSGGSVYGKDVMCPINEDSITNPISSYGLQKLTIEKLLFLYNYIYGIDYRIIRLSNPYGPYQRPNGVLGAVTTFTYQAINNLPITIYGDGSVIRDFIYVDDFIAALNNIVFENGTNKLYNIGSGKGTSISNLLLKIEKVLNLKLNVVYKAKRNVDVPCNFLDISRYKNDFGDLQLTTLEEGIKKTALFLKNINY